MVLEKPIIKERLRSRKRNIPLNNAYSDRLSISVLVNARNDIRKVENISYEINLNDKWEWIVRYDDHGGEGSLHPHFRISLSDSRNIESAAEIAEGKNKNQQLTWACDDVKKNYLTYRSTFLKNNGLDIY